MNKILLKQKVCPAALLFLLFNVVGLTIANPVDIDIAREVGFRFVNVNANTKLRSIDELELAATIKTESGIPAFHVFNSPNGFVIVAADNVAHPVLGYSFERQWPTEGKLPPQVTDYLDDLAGQIEAASVLEPDRGTKMEWEELLSADPNNPPQPKGTRTQVGPLLTTTWDQGQYYNAMCPEDGDGPDGHALTGCVATAMAQIINYHGYPANGRGTHSYNSSYGELSVNYAESQYDYSNMPDALTNESSEAQVDAVAKLMYDCGVAANMNYGESESGAYVFDARSGLINYFRFSPNLSFAGKSSFSNADWNNLLQSDLSKGLPIFYCGQGAQGSHSFVCDGYNSDDYYHFNFGWGGFADGWYLISLLNPDGNEYNSAQSVIVGIVPDSSANIVLCQMFGKSQFVVDEPMELGHMLSHNKYSIHVSDVIPSQTTVAFLPIDSMNQIEADVVSYCNQNILVYDGEIDEDELVLSFLEGFHWLSSVVSTTSTNHELTVHTYGHVTEDGFRLLVQDQKSCPRVSGCVATASNDSVYISWTENGAALQWQVEYGFCGFQHGSGTLLTVNDTSVVIGGGAYLTDYDFYIRPICDTNDFGAWKPIVVTTSAPYWQDVVVSQPDSYFINSEGTAMISSAEDFAWWGEHDYFNRDAKLMSDINLEGYRWRPINFCYKLDGDGYCIDNLTIIEDNSSYYNVGLIGELGVGGIISNLVIKNCKIDGGIYTGAIFGTQYRGEVFNCCVLDGSVKGENCVGGIGGRLIGDGGCVCNCFSNVQVRAPIVLLSGALMGEMSGASLVCNCYGTNNYPMLSYGNAHALIGRMQHGVLKNCYSKTPYEMFVRVSEVGTTVSDTSSFNGQGLEWTLNNSVMFEDVEVTDLCQALNMGVIGMNNEKYKVWGPDVNNINKGFPVFGDLYIVSCPNVTDISVNNIIVGEENGVVVSWKDEESTNHEWQIKYKRHDLPTDSPIIINTTSNPDTLFNIPRSFEYDFNVRTLCGGSDFSGWSSTVTQFVDLPYWIEIVKSQPEGYYEDIAGNVFITSAEGLAWLAVNTKEEIDNYFGKKVSLLCDIDISAYRWYPIGDFFGSFNGNGHKISGIYINSNEFNHCGLFGYYYGDTLQNVNMDGGSVVNQYSNGSNIGTGGLVGALGNDYSNQVVNNCHSSIQVIGVNNVGSLLGRADRSSINNSSASGQVFGEGYANGCLIGASIETQVINCCATGDVFNNSKDGGWDQGGLIGNPRSSYIHNCYSTGNVFYSGTPHFVGKVMGDFPSDCANIYGLIDSVVPNMFGTENLFSNNKANVRGSCQDTIWFNNSGVFVSSVAINNIFYTNLLSALNAWVDANNTNGEFLHWVADTENVNGGFPLLVAAPSAITQTTSLVPGWNWWSTFIEMDGVDGLTLLENGLGENGMIIKSPNGNYLEYYSEWEMWWGNDFAIENTSMYEIKTNAACALPIAGIRATPSSHPITIRPGWNWIGYTASASLTTEAALSSLTPSEDDIIQSRLGFSQYWPGFGFWGSIETMSPGNGYKYRSNSTENQTLVYPSGNRGMLSEMEEQLVSASLQHQYFMDVVAVVELDEESVRNDLFEVRALSKGQIRGCTSLRYCELIDRYVAMLVVYGDGEEDIAFSLVDKANGSTYYGPDVMTFKSDEVVGSLKEPKHLRFGHNWENTSRYVIDRVFPNPVVAGGNFNLAVADGLDDDVIEKLEIVNVYGQSVFTASSVAASASMTAPETAGVYVLRILADGKTYYGTLIVTK